MNTQTVLDNVATGVVKVLKERDNDMGIDFCKVGEFNNFTELINLIVDAYPFEELDWNDVYTFLSQGYVEVDDDDIDEIQINDNAVYIHYRDFVAVLDYCENLILDTTTENYLLGFSNTGWARIDGAIDLETMTVGYFNSLNGDYQPVFELNEWDSYLLETVLDNLGSELSVDCEYTVNRING